MFQTIRQVVSSSRRTHTISIFLIALATSALASDPPTKRFKKPDATPAPSTSADLSRYPDHIPDWLWKDQRRSAIITPKLRKELEADLAELAKLAMLEDQTQYDAKHTAIRLKLNNAFTIRDLAADGHMVMNKRLGLSLAVQIDPTFNDSAKETIRKSADLFLQLALDPAVIREAMETSTDRPEPMPAEFEMKDGQPVKDEFGNKVYTENYKYFLTDRFRPKDGEALTKQIQLALSPATGDPAVLAVSVVTGGKWWGSGRIGFAVGTEYQIARQTPASGLLYIGLRSDRLKADVPDGENAAFWASKMAHEFLHNLGYDHPLYADPAERDANNQGNRKSFLVAYEQAILARAKVLSK